MDWIPHPRQLEALRKKEFEVLYGGARGGGKTDAGLVWLTDYIKHPRYRALVIRKNANDLTDWVDRATRFYVHLGAKIVYHPAEIRFISGAVIRTGHLKDDQAYTKYQGQEYQRMLIEELTQIPDLKRYLQLLGSCRSTIPEIPPQVFATTNPGGVGHKWVKERFVDPAPAGIRFVDKNIGRSRIFIPATVDDNPTLVKSDPKYISMLEGLKETDVDLWKAWRLGDWNIFAGQYFREFRIRLHTCNPFEPKSSFVKFAGIDWGYAPRPFVFLAAAFEQVKYVDDNDYEYNFNRLWVYREISGIEKTPQVWAGEIKEGVSLPEFSWIRGDPSMNIRKPDGSRSIIDQFKEQGITILPANNDRINGWIALRNWLSIAPDELPYLIISQQCHNLITHLPSLIYDENNTQDLDTDGLDDEADALRYMIIHAKWIDAKVGAVKRPSHKVLPPRFVGLISPAKFR